MAMSHTVSKNKNTDATLLTTAEVAEILRVNRRTVHRWRIAGTLPCVRVGDKTFRYRASDIYKRLEIQNASSVAPLVYGRSAVADEDAALEAPPHPEMPLGRVGYVRSPAGIYLVEVPSDEHGFEYHSATESWPRGQGLKGEWEQVEDEDVPTRVRERLDPVIEQWKESFR